MALKVIATLNGVETDITEGVRVLYDSVINSIDWGSGFLDNAEVMTILETGQSCGFILPKSSSSMYKSLLEELSERFISQARPPQEGN